VPTGRRETSSLLLLGDDPDEALVVDAGTGLRRLVTDPSVLEGRTRITVLLTHFHPDHTCGLMYLGEAPSLQQFTIIGPAMALHGISTHDALDRHYASPVFPSGVANIGARRCRTTRPLSSRSAR